MYYKHPSQGSLQWSDFSRHVGQIRQQLVLGSSVTENGSKKWSATTTVPRMSIPKHNHSQANCILEFLGQWRGLQLTIEVGSRLLDCLCGLMCHPSQSAVWRSTTTIFPLSMPKTQWNTLNGWCLGAKSCSPEWSFQKMGMSENGVYPQWNSHLVGIMISKTIGYNGVHNIFRHTQIASHTANPWRIQSIWNAVTGEGEGHGALCGFQRSQGWCSSGHFDRTELTGLNGDEHLLVQTLDKARYILKMQLIAGRSQFHCITYI